MPTDIKRIPLDPGKGDKPTETSGGTIPRSGTGGNAIAQTPRSKGRQDGDKHA